jgi:hypothetical protein
MLFPFYNYPAPEPMSPSHAKRQSQATATPDAAVDLQYLVLPVEVPTSKTFDNAETTIETVEHSLNQCVCFLLFKVPEPDFRSSDTPLSPHRLQVLGVNPTCFTNPIDQRT